MTTKWSQVRRKSGAPPLPTTTAGRALVSSEDGVERRGELRRYVAAIEAEMAIRASYWKQKAKSEGIQHWKNNHDHQVRIKQKLQGHLLALRAAVERLAVTAEDRAVLTDTDAWASVAVGEITAKADARWRKALWGLGVKNMLGDLFCPCDGLQHGSVVHVLPVHCQTETCGLCDLLEDDE